VTARRNFTRPLTELGSPDSENIMAVPEEYAAACENAVLFDLSARSKIELAGREARMFLNNLCTNDVKNLAAGSGCEAFLCTAKARVVAHVIVGCFHRGDQDVLWLDGEPGCNEKVLAHLNHYLISEQVELTDRTRELSLLRLIGPRADAIVQDYLAKDVTKLPTWHNVSCRPPDGSDAIYVRRQGFLSLPGVDLFCSSAQAAQITTDLSSASVTVASAETHEILRVEAGTPVFGKDMDENRFVMEVGRTTQAICYTKGCFLGQEPIVMARDRGHLNRLLQGATMADGELLQPGARLFRGGDEVGQATSSVHSPRLGQIISLAYLKRGNWDAGTALTIEPDSDGRDAVVAALPFVSSG
jgi:folate-binding protein YgfZ